MQAVIHMPVLLGAIQYSLAYMLCGGGVIGAIGVYVLAKAFNK